LKLLSITTTTTITITRHHHHHFNCSLPGEHWLATFSVFTLHLFGKEPFGMGDVVHDFAGQTYFLSTKQQCQTHSNGIQLKALNPTWKNHSPTSSFLHSHKTPDGRAIAALMPVI